MGVFSLIGSVIELGDAIVSPVIDTAEDIIKGITEEMK